MKNVISGYTFFVLAWIFLLQCNLSFSQNLPELPQGQEWHLVFEDEFDGIDLDPGKWVRLVDNRHKPTHLTKWIPAANTVRNGKLVITTSNAGYEQGGKPVYYSGAISTRDKFNTSFGYYESKLKFMEGAPGVNGAFWLMSNNVTEVDGSGQDGTEIDILENPWHTGKFQHALHWDGYSDAHQHVNKIFPPDDQFKPGTWHILGLWWTPEEYVFYVDGVETWRTSAGGVSQVKDAYVQYSSNVTAPWGVDGAFNPNNLPVVFEVEYVKVYSLDASRTYKVQIMPDPGFEIGQWGMVNKAPSKAIFSYSSEDVYEGDKAMKVEVMEVQAGNQNEWKLSLRNTLNLNENTRYWLSFYAKASSDDVKLKTSINYDSKATAEAYEVKKLDNTFTLTSTWTRYELQFETTDMINAKDQNIFFIRFPEVATYYVDSVTIKADPPHREEEQIITGGLNEQKKITTVYPNPTTSKVYVNIKDPATSTPKISVINSGSKEVKFEIEQLNDSTMINLNGNPPGVYFITIQSKSNKVVKKVILQK